MNWSCVGTGAWEPAGPDAAPAGIVGAAVEAEPQPATVTTSAASGASRRPVMTRRDRRVSAAGPRAGRPAAGRRRAQVVTRDERLLLITRPAQPKGSTRATRWSAC
ncbi:hypothetical protein BZL29_5223 [Mycobacterium kansasii]|uniref:Uncharacterized protein n=1 Tax=Mycobacterium kansasii TaxID=1768 RepID=A0A1V3X222_MYCKA|nr:hypothetical protein BZL29_5223 [Mycobacterium kansasii]